MNRKVSISAAVVLLLAVAPHAQAQNAAAAEALFQEGQAALEKGDWNVACPKLRESDRLDPANGTKLNLADCEEKRGRLATAWELYRKLSDTLPAGDERLPYAQQRAQALGPRVPRLALKLAADAPPDTQASIESLVLTAASFGTALPVDPGKHQVVVSSGTAKRSFSVVLREGETKELEITPLSSREEPEPQPNSSPVPPSQGTPASDQGEGHDTKTIGYVVGGVGVVGLAVGAITGIVGLSKQSTGNDNCDNVHRTCNQTGVDANNTARTMAPISTVGLIVGVLGVGAGAYLILTSKPSHSVAIGTEVHGGAASLSLNARF
jgi:hypothetical protein